MLDTNIVSEAMRNPRGVVSRKIQSLDGGAYCCSIVVAAELRYGAEKQGGEIWKDRVEKTLSAITVLPLGWPADRIYGEIRSALEIAGTPIGPNDLMIVAHAVASKLTLVTANEREFRRVNQLTVENWLQ